VALARIRQLGLMKEWDVDNLAGAYRFFRLVEHRLQMMHQLQTHTLPDSDAEIELLARRVSNGPLGSFTADTFVKTLSRHLNHVRTLADSFFEGESVHPHSVLLMLPEDSERAMAIVRQYGIDDVARDSHPARDGVRLFRACSTGARAFRTCFRPARGRPPPPPTRSRRWRTSRRSRPRRRARLRSIACSSIPRRSGSS
jgi:glutamate-ammonia-ligase adenylyltransferase